MRDICARTRETIGVAKAKSASVASRADALDAFEGEKPNAERLRHGDAEIVRLSDYDPALRGRAVRVSVAWPLETAFKRRQISKRQFDAAQRLLDLYEQGGIGRIKVASYVERVDGAGVAARSGHDAGAAARDRYLKALSMFGPVQRGVIEAAVVMGYDVATIAAMSDSDELPAGAKRRAEAVMVMVRCGLDALAIQLGC